METAPNEFASFEPFRVYYSSDGYQLQGYMLLPEGSGPFPAILFEHGSSGLLPSNRPGIEVLQRLGFAVFVAIRRGQNGNPGPSWLSQISELWGSAEMGTQLVQALSSETNDVEAALAWLQVHPQIDPQRLAIVGHSFGAVVTIFALARTKLLRAAVYFAGPSQSWPDAPALQQAMLAAVQDITTPCFLIQAQNDHSLLPTYALGMEFARFNKPHETRIYPPHGATPMEGHGLFGRGIELWQTDVARFLTHFV